MSLAPLADRASRSPFFFGHALREFATARHWTNAALAQWLGVPVETLHALRLCRAPGSDPRTTAEADCVAIATRYGVSVERLREVMG